MVAVPDLCFLAYGPVGGLWEDWNQHRERLFHGPVGTAKTAGIVKWCADMCEDYPGVRFLWFRKTRVSMNESVLQTFRKVMLDPHFYLLDEFGDDPDPEVFEATRQYLAQRNGYLFEGPSDAMRQNFEFRRPEGYYGPPSRIVLAGMDNPTKLFSTEYDAAYCNEINELTLDEFESVRRALRSRTLPFHPIIGDCNPDHPKHWLMGRASDGRLNAQQVEWSDNPWVRHTEAGRAYKEDIRQTYTGHRLRRMYYGEWVAAEGAIWPEFNPAVHEIGGKLEKRMGKWYLDLTDAPEGLGDSVPLEWFFGSQDWGHTNPGCQQVWGVDKAGRMYLVREHYHTHKTIDWWAEKAAEAYRDFRCSPFTCDANNDAGQNGIAMFNDRVGDTDKGNAARFAIPHVRAPYKVGFDAVRERLMPAKDGLPRIFFLKTALAHAPDTEWLGSKPDRTVEEIPGYSYKAVEDDKEDKEEPIKVNDHGCDSLRYACLWAWNRDHSSKEPAHEYEEGTWGDLLNLRGRGIA